MEQGAVAVVPLLEVGEGRAPRLAQRLRDLLPGDLLLRLVSLLLVEDGEPLAVLAHPEGVEALPWVVDHGGLLRRVGEVEQADRGLRVVRDHHGDGAECGDRLDAPGVLLRREGLQGVGLQPLDRRRALHDEDRAVRREEHAHDLAAQPDATLHGERRGVELVERAVAAAGDESRPVGGDGDGEAVREAASLRRRRHAEQRRERRHQAQERDPRRRAHGRSPSDAQCRNRAAPGRVRGRPRVGSCPGRLPGDARVRAGASVAGGPGYPGACVTPDAPRCCSCSSRCWRAAARRAPRSRTWRSRGAARCTPRRGRPGRRTARGAACPTSPTRATAAGRPRSSSSGRRRRRRGGRPRRRPDRAHRRDGRVPGGARPRIAGGRRRARAGRSASASTGCSRSRTRGRAARRGRVREPDRLHAARDHDREEPPDLPRRSPTPGRGPPAGRGRRGRRATRCSSRTRRRSPSATTCSLGWTITDAFVAEHGMTGHVAGLQRHVAGRLPAGGRRRGHGRRRRTA